MTADPAPVDSTREALLAAGFDHREADAIIADSPGCRAAAEYVLLHGSGPEDERALKVVRALIAASAAPNQDTAA